MYTEWQYKDELYHHGIKGQRWGIRRYQNPDGTLTEAGRKRYNKIVVPKGSTVFRGVKNGSTNFMNRNYTYVNITDDYSKHHINTTSGFEWRYDTDIVMKTTKPLKIATERDFINEVKELYGLKGVKNAFDLPQEYREGDRSGGKTWDKMDKIVKSLQNKGFDGVLDPIDSGTNKVADPDGEEKIATILFNPKDKVKIVGAYSR